MSKEIMTEEAFYELIENLEVVDKLTIYGKNAIKYWALKLQKENKLAKEQLKKQCEIADERNDLLVKVQKLQKENEEKNNQIEKDREIKKRLCKESNKLFLENKELEKNIDRLIEEQKEREKYVHSLEIKIQKLMKKNERKNKIINSKDRLIYITGIELRNAEKQIELMAEYIANISDCPAEIFNVNFACANRCNASIDKECWVKYFENKVKEEQNG